MLCLGAARLTARVLRPRSYTAQVLAKSCKTIPVMLAGVFLHGKRYKSLEYLSAVLIAGTPAAPPPRPSSLPSPSPRLIRSAFSR